MSTGLNSLAAIWFAELEGTQFKANLSDRGRGLAVKMFSLGFGLLSFGLVFLVPYMSGLAPVAIALSSFFSGTLFGLFMLGMYVPFANAAVSCRTPSTTPTQRHVAGRDSHFRSRNSRALP